MVYVYVWGEGEGVNRKIKIKSEASIKHLNAMAWQAGNHCKYQLA